MNYHIFMGHYFTNQELIVAAVILVVLIAVAIGVFIQRRGARTLAFRNRFGSNTNAPFSRMAPRAKPKQNWLTGKLAWKL